MAADKKISLREWRALPPSEQRLIFYQVLRPDGQWQSVSIPEILEDDFSELINEYKNEKGIPLKVFQKWYEERFGFL